MSDVIISTDGAIASIRIDRPRKKNALTAAMYLAMVEGLERFDADTGVRVVTLTGGDDFTAGNDLNDFLAIRDDFQGAPPMRFLRALHRFAKPIVAGVRGVAVGIGTTMLLHVDITIASESARFSLPFVHLGIVPEAASTLLLPLVIGRARASLLLLGGETFDAHAAREMGLIASVVKDADLDGAVRGYAERLAALPLGALLETKRLLRGSLEEAVEQRMREEANIVGERLKSQEFLDVVTRFLGGP